MVRNPRPCAVCGCVQQVHEIVQLAHAYRPAKRTEPLRAKREPQRVSGHFWHQRLDEMEPPPVTREEVEQIVMDALDRLHREALLR